MSRRLNLHWASPLPPQPTDIAAFTARLMPHLAARAELTLWAPDDGDLPAIDGMTPRPFTEPVDWRALNRADAVVWNLGNDARFHGAFLRAARLFPGIVILHDANLLEAVLQAYDHRLALAEVEREHGSAARAIAQSILSGRGHAAREAGAAPMIRLMLRSALMGVVHSDRLAAALAEDPEMPPILALDLPYPAAPSAKKESRPQAAARRLIVFGYLAANRRLPDIVDALGCYPRRDRFHLDIYGVLQDRVALEAGLIRNRMHEQVTVQGYVDDDALDNAIAGADLAINLRRPTLGEASGAQLRIWNQATASLVTNDGWYADLPDDCVLKADPDNERGAIHRALDLALDQPERLQALGDAGRGRLMQHHRPEMYADALLAALDDVDGLNRRRAALFAAARYRQAGARLPGLTRQAEISLLKHRLIALAGG